MAWLFIQELGRKIIHLGILFVLIGYAVISDQFSTQLALFVLTGLLIAFFIMEYLRLEMNWTPRIVAWFIRPKESNRVSAVIFFLSATIITLAVFDFRIAMAALLMATFGDMAAALIGTRYGSTLFFRDKTVAGSVAELAVNLLVGFLVLNNVYVILVMAFGATMAEILVSELDDNLVVPVVAAFLGQITMLLL